MSNRCRRALAWLPAVVLALAGCQNPQSREAQAKQQQLSAVSAERDQLMREMTDNARLMSQIGVELARVRVPANQLHVSRESPMMASRDSVIQRIHYITTRLNESESRLRRSEERVQSLTQLSDSLRTTLDSTLTTYAAILETQRATIASMTEQVTQLTAQNAALTDTVNQLATATNKVFYVIGTEHELIQRGIIRKEGGSRFLFVLWKSGQTLVPGRQLDPSEFRTLNKREVREIALPDSTRRYRIASRQDLNALEAPPSPSQNGKVTGSVLRIADPERFWATSKFLIIVQS
jgi:DNA repair exonuclease SbcCD ATPase subunit